MSDYYFHQPLLESLNDWGLQNPQAWAQNELANEVLLAGIEAELEGRIIARDEAGDNADEGHDERIQKLENSAQTVKNRIAHLNWEYDYEDTQAQYGGGHGEEEDGGERDMDLESDS